MKTSTTCYARLAWLEKYEAKSRGVLNILKHSERFQYEEYKLCRQCRGIEKIEKPKRTRAKKWTGPCPCGAEKIYAKGICINCYQKARRANA